MLGRTTLLLVLLQQLRALNLDPNFNEVFDASLVYGPIFGRMTYAGLRWTLGK